jgi:signal peptide peptidase SppA
MRYERILAAVAAQPWAIEPTKAEVIAAFLTRKVGGEDIPDAEVAAAVAQKRPKGRPRAGSVAVVPLFGVMMQRADMIDQMSGATSTEAVGRAVDEAAADPSVEAVILDIDSPGGSVFGVPELAAKVAAAAKQKKVIAVADSLAASGAYWVASQASELVVTPGGQVGSIGVINMHVDSSKAMEAAGRTVTVVRAGERKVLNHPLQPLSALGLEEMQASVNDYYAMFVRSVAGGRRVSQTAVRDGFGRGGMLRADGAVKEGMADRVATLEDVLARFGVSASDVAPTAAAGFDPRAEVRRRGIEIRERERHRD